LFSFCLLSALLWHNQRQWLRTDLAKMQHGAKQRHSVFGSGNHSHTDTCHDLLQQPWSCWKILATAEHSGIENSHRYHYIRERKDKWHGISIYSRD
jgi:hypothetical protein